jgi:hypothetical protein
MNDKSFIGTRNGEIEKGILTYVEIPDNLLEILDFSFIENFKTILRANKFRNIKHRKREPKLKNKLDLLVWVKKDRSSIPFFDYSIWDNDIKKIYTYEEKKIKKIKKIKDFEDYDDYKDYITDICITSQDEAEIREVYNQIKKDSYFCGYLVANDFTSADIIEEIYKNFKNNMDYEFFECFIQNPFTNLPSYIIEELFNNFCKDTNNEWKENVEDYEEVLEYFLIHYNTPETIQEIISPYLE